MRPFCCGTWCRTAVGCRLQLDRVREWAIGKRGIVKEISGAKCDPLYYAKALHDIPAETAQLELVEQF